MFRINERRHQLRVILVFALAVILAGTVIVRASVSASEGPVAHMVYFYADDCPHCKTIIDEVLSPAQAQYGEQVAIKYVEISEATGFEIYIAALLEGERDIPALLIGDQVLIGEDKIRTQLCCVIDSALSSDGTPWPDIPGLEGMSEEAPSQGLGIGFGEGGGVAEPCESEGDACEVDQPIYAAYFYEVGCQECSRAEYDIRYVRGQYGQLIVREYNVQDDATLHEWLSLRLGLPEQQHLATPSLFIGDDYLIGDGISAEALLGLMEKYAPVGALEFWRDFDVEVAEQSIVERFKSFGALTVAFAGLIDGLNPCAFATLVFFVSYLALSGRQGRDVLAVGIAFTLGVFLAYLAVGFGFYKILELLKGLLTTLGRWVYALTGLVCAVLAIFSFLDFLKARRGEIGDMALSLPHPLRKRINAVIRQGRRARAFVAFSFFTGVAVSFLELACTGQVYLPTIIFVLSQPDMRVRATLFLVLYNVAFIVPLVVVFIMAYYGTGSKQLTQFLQRNAATVKLGMAMLFVALSTWLLVSVVTG